MRGNRRVNAAFRQVGQTKKELYLTENEETEEEKTEALS